MIPSLRFLALATIGFGALCNAHAADTDDAATDTPPPSPQPADMAPAEKSPIIAELGALLHDFKAKLAATEGDPREEAFAAELGRFDSIVAKFPDAKPEEKVAVLWMKAKVLVDLFQSYDEAKAIVSKTKVDYPKTEFAAQTDTFLSMIDSERRIQELRSSLVAGAVFPGVEGKALDGSAVSTAALKGKVVLVDFWATWCPPCRDELPHVLAAYEKFHAKGFEVVAVSLDRDVEELKKFIEEKKLPWAQIFEGADDIAEKFGIESIPTTYLIGADGKIVANNLRGEALATKLGELLGGK